MRVKAALYGLPRFIGSYNRKQVTDDRRQIVIKTEGGSILSKFCLLFSDF
jgi:hypothetical protein